MNPLTEQLRRAVERTKQLAERSGYLVAESRRIKSMSAGIRDDAAMLRATIYIAGIQQRSRSMMLPAKAIDGSKSAVTIRAPMASPAANRHIKVPIADDNDDTVLTLSALLEDEGYSVRRARDGRQTEPRIANLPVHASSASTGPPPLRDHSARPITTLADLQQKAYPKRPEE